MDGIHDMGGTSGWGKAHRPDPAERVFPQEWEGRAFALALLSMRVSGTNLDAFRHSMERLDRARYVDDTYYGRWLNGAENLLIDSGIIAPGAIDARARHLLGEEATEPDVPEPHKPDYAPTGPGSLRIVETPPAFATGQLVRAKNISPAGHTRLAKYVRGHSGVIERVRPAALLPDTHAHFLGENAQHVYSVRFDGQELWGASSEALTLNIDLFESYLEAAS
jgi:nitrile hydratase